MSGLDFFLIFLCTTVIRSGDNTGDDDDDNDDNKTNSTNNLNCLVFMVAVIKSCFNVMQHLFDLCCINRCMCTVYQ